MFVTNWISTTKIQKISEITNFFRHYFLSRTEVIVDLKLMLVGKLHPVREEWVQLFHFQKYNLSITIKEPPKMVK